FNCITDWILDLDPSPKDLRLWNPSSYVGLQQHELLFISANAISSSSPRLRSPLLFVNASSSSSHSASFTSSTGARKHTQ
ncbi:unnamed protein product, partial [Prunus brigantina]